MTRIASFFSGIGGLELGLEAALSAETVFQCELSAWNRDVLSKHWPGVPCHGDIDTLRADAIPAADVWCGGFPCTDLSHANPVRTGLGGSRSGLWYVWRDLIAQVLPVHIVVENVHAAWRDWMPELRRQLHELGYASLPVRVSAEDVGAPHRRARCFLVAHRDGGGCAELEERHGKQDPGRQSPRRYNAVRLDPSAAHAHVQGLEEPQGQRGHAATELAPPPGSPWGPHPPPVRGVDDGVPPRLDRPHIEAYGRAVVPQVAYAVGMIAAEWWGR